MLIHNMGILDLRKQILMVSQKRPHPLDKLIDKRNEQLYLDLEKKYDIVIEEYNEPHYSIWSNRNKATISLPIGNYNPASFTHELLHLYLKVENLDIYLDLKVQINAAGLQNIYDEYTMDCMSNCLEHIKMLPLFLELGYERRNFIYDYEMDKMPEEDLNKLREYYSNPLTASNPILTRNYIGRYFSAIACPNTDIDYKTKLEKLKNIEPELYSIQHNLVQGWNNHSPDRYEIVVDYCSNMINWAKEK